MCGRIADPLRETRILSFEDDRLVGRLYVRRRDDSTALEWRKFAEARGVIRVPAGYDVKLWINRLGAADLSFLNRLHHDAIQFIELGDSPVPEEQLFHLQKLAGLMGLKLGRVRFSAQGLGFLERLENLRQLTFASDTIGDDDLKFLQNLTKLEKLTFSSHSISGQGLAHLQNLPKLTSLDLCCSLEKPGSMQLGCLHHLKSLILAEQALVDEDLKTIGELVGLEELDISGTKIQGNGFLYLQSMQQIRSLNISRLEKVDENSLGYLTICPKLEEIHCDQTSIGETGIGFIAHLPALRKLTLWESLRVSQGLENLQHAKHLEEIYLSENPLGDGWLEDIVGLNSLRKIELTLTNLTDLGLSFLGQLERLTDLGLGGNPKISDAGLAHLRNCTHLEWLDLSDSAVSDEGLAYLEKMSQLRFINLAGTRVRGNGLHHLSRMTFLKVLYLGGTDGLDLRNVLFLRDMKNLRTVWITTEVTDAGLHNLGELSQISALWLDHTRLTGSGLSDLKGLKNLKSLHLQGNPIQDDKLSQLSGFAGLTEFDLSDTLIGDSGILLLANLPHLEKLDLHRTRVSDRSISTLSKLQDLEFVDLSNTRVSPDGLNSLRKMLPNCRII